jgi:hypothetical protein
MELTGSTSYEFRLANTSSTSQWCPVPNAIAVFVSEAASASAPDAASGLTATAASSGQINLSWTDNSGDETGFKIQRSTTSGTGFSTIATTAADATSYSDTGRTPGTEYFYQVVATNGAGDSAATLVASATTWTEEEQYYSDNQLSHNVDPTLDSDGDGVSNADEFVAGTNPNDGNDVFEVAPASSPGGMRLQAPTVNGKYYRVLWRASLTTGDWSVVTGQEGTDPHDGSGIDLPVTDDGFYRIEVSNQPWIASP